MRRPAHGDERGVGADFDRERRGGEDPARHVDGIGSGQRRGQRGDEAGEVELVAFGDVDVAASDRDPRTRCRRHQDRRRATGRPRRADGPPQPDYRRWARRRRRRQRRGRRGAAGASGVGRASATANPAGRLGRGLSSSASAPPMSPWNMQRGRADGVVELLEDRVRALGQHVSGAERQLEDAPEVTRLVGDEDGEAEADESRRRDVRRSSSRSAATTASISLLGGSVATRLWARAHRSSCMEGLAAVSGSAAASHASAISTGGEPEARVDEVDRRSTQRHLITEPDRQLPARHDVATTRDHRPSPYGERRRWQRTLATEIGEERVPQVVGHEGATVPGDQGDACAEVVDVERQPAHLLHLGHRRRAERAQRLERPPVVGREAVDDLLPQVVVGGTAGCGERQAYHRRPATEVLVGRRGAEPVGEVGDLGGVEAEVLVGDLEQLAGGSQTGQPDRRQLPADEHEAEVAGEGVEQLAEEVDAAVVQRLDVVDDETDPQRRMAAHRGLEPRERRSTRRQLGPERHGRRGHEPHRVLAPPAAGDPSLDPARGQAVGPHRLGHRDGLAEAGAVPRSS